MKNKIRDIIMYSSNGVLFLPLASLVLLCLPLIFNNLLLSSSGATLILFAPICLLLPTLIYLSFYKTSPIGLYKTMPKRIHIPLLVFAFFAIAPGALFFELLFSKNEYLSLYGSFSSETKNVFMYVFYLLSFGIIAPVLEELLFRGVLFKGLKEKGLAVSVIVTSLFYSLLDFDLRTLPSRLFVSVVLCLVYQTTGSLIASSVLHILYNIFALTLEPILLAMKRVSGQTELFLFLTIITALFAFALFLNQSARVYAHYAEDDLTERDEHETNIKDIPKLLYKQMISVPAISSLGLYLIVIIIRSFI